MALPKTTRKKKARAPVRRKTGVTAFSFEGWETWTGEEYHRKTVALRAELYAEFKVADLLPDVYLWMKDNGYDKKDIAAAKKAPNHGAHTLGISCKMMNMGMPDYNEKHDVYWQSLAGTMGTVKPASEWIKKRVDELVATGAKVVEEVKKEEKAKAGVYVPTIQERLLEQARIQSEAIEEWLEGWIRDPKSFDPKGFDFKKHFQDSGVTQAHARKLKGFYENELADYDELERMPSAGQLKKMDEHDADMWQQLKEGYAHLVKADIKKFRTAIEELMAALDFVIDAAKATRKPRKAKPKSATKLVEKLKFLKVDQKFKLASISPEQIIGASELWVFNVKTRKLGKYVASNIDPTGTGRAGSGLQVKGTTIIGFNEAESIQKTLRKPEEQLKEFKDAGKVKLRKFLDDIKTTDTKLNGRCNPDTVLLKVN